MSIGFVALFHVYSTKSVLQPQVIHFPGLHIYHSRNKAEDEPYVEIKKKDSKSRSLLWYLPNKKPERLKDNLNCFEELLDSDKVVNVLWLTSQKYQFLLASGVIVTMSVATQTTDVEKICIDRNLTTKINDDICDGVLQEHFMIFSLLKMSKLLLVNFERKSIIEKKDVESKIFSVDIPGHSYQGFKKNLAINADHSLVSVWWTRYFQEVHPGTDLQKNAQANLVLLTLTGISNVYSLEIMNFILTDDDLLHASFSVQNPDQILTVEQVCITQTKSSVYSNTYKMTKNRIVKMSSPSLAVKGEVVCLSRSHYQSKIVLFISNKSLILWDVVGKRSEAVQPAFSNFMPTQVEENCCLINWHPNDCAFVIANTRADIQIFDQALNPLFLQLVSDSLEREKYLRLSRFFFTAPKLSRLCWFNDTQGSTDLLLVYERGPICTVRMQHNFTSVLRNVNLVCGYLRRSSFKEAVQLLCWMDWNLCGEECFQSLCFIAEYLFKTRFDGDVENLIEESLGSFYAPSIPLSEPVIMVYRDDICLVARRFFHVLLRNHRFKKAFLLAVDIGAKDLFMDIYYLATNNGQHELAEASKHRALKLHEDEGGEAIHPDFFSSKHSNDVSSMTDQLGATSITTPDFHEEGLRRDAASRSNRQYNFIPVPKRCANARFLTKETNEPQGSSEAEFV